MTVKHYRKISSTKLLLALDRLTRFKPTFEKYERVFLDIVSQHSDINAKSLSPKELAQAAESIFEFTLGKSEDKYLSDLLRAEEEEMFYQDDESRALLEVDINIQKALGLIGESLPKNLQRLVFQGQNRGIKPKELRQEHSLKYPIKKVILTEGITEEILLEELAKQQGYDFEKEGVFLLGAGGKNQVARKYYKMINEIRLPIFILLDSDATEVGEMILPRLRGRDSLYIIKSGEFEDILSKDLILNAINAHFKNNFQCKHDELDLRLPMSKNLKEIFRIKGFGDFKKSEFAKILKNYSMKTKQGKASGELLHIIDLIKVLS